MIWNFGIKRLIFYRHFKVILITLSVFCFLLLIAFYSTKNSLKYRYGDIDGDGIANMDDNDVDGDGRINVWDKDADGDGVENIKDALDGARKLIGRPYDQLMGGLNNIGWKLGGIVCIDVINLAFEKAGVYFEKELRDCYKKTPWYFSEKRWNNPWDKNFARRVKNFRAYCRAKGYILKQGKKIKPGDIVMFGTGHIALVESVEKDDFTVIESAGKRIITMRAKKTGLYKRNVERYGEAVFARISFKKKLHYYKRKN